METTTSAEIMEEQEIHESSNESNDHQNNQNGDQNEVNDNKNDNQKKLTKNTKRNKKFNTTKKGKINEISETGTEMIGKENKEEVAEKDKVEENEKKSESERKQPEVDVVQNPPKEKRIPKRREKTAKKATEVSEAQKVPEQSATNVENSEKPQTSGANGETRRSNSKRAPQKTTKASGAEEIQTSLNLNEHPAEASNQLPVEIPPEKVVRDRKGKKKPVSQQKILEQEKDMKQDSSPIAVNSDIPEESPKVLENQRKPSQPRQQSRKVSYSPQIGESTEVDDVPVASAPNSRNGKQNSKRSKKSSTQSDTQLSELVSNLSLKESSSVPPAPSGDIHSVPTKFYCATTYYKDYETDMFLSQFRLYLNLSDALEEKMRMIKESENHKLKNHQNGSTRSKPKKKDQKLYDSLFFKGDDLVVEIREIDLSKISSDTYDHNFFHSQVTL